VERSAKLEERHPLPWTSVVIHDLRRHPVTNPDTGFIRQYFVDAVGQTVRSDDGKLLHVTLRQDGSLVLGADGKPELEAFEQDPSWRDHRGEAIP
jgi:hypothetical protein